MARIATGVAVTRAIVHRQGLGLPLDNIQRHDPSLYQAARRVYGTWRHALASAGVKPLCGPCWTQQSIIDAILDRQRSGPPLSSVWRDNRPLFRAAVNHFGNWQRALEAAGISVRFRRKWSSEEVLFDLRVWYCRGQTRIRHVDPGLADAARRYFGSLLKACEAAGLAPPGGRWSKRRIVEAIQDGYVKGRPLQIAGFRDVRLATAAKRHFGSWRVAVDAAGLTSRIPPPSRHQRTWSPTAVVLAIQEHYQAGFPSPSVWQTDSGLYSAAKKHFGTWRAAVRAAGLQPTNRRWSHELVIGEIVDRFNRGLPLTSVVFQEDSPLAGAAVRYFGSWRKALVAAGLDPKSESAQCEKQHDKEIPCNESK